MPNSISAPSSPVIPLAYFAASTDANSGEASAPGHGVLPTADPAPSGGSSLPRDGNRAGAARLRRQFASETWRNTKAWTDAIATSQPSAPTVAAAERDEAEAGVTHTQVPTGEYEDPASRARPVGSRGGNVPSDTSSVSAHEEEDEFPEIGPEEIDQPHDSEPTSSWTEQPDTRNVRTTDKDLPPPSDTRRERHVSKRVVSGRDKLPSAQAHTAQAAQNGKLDALHATVNALREQLEKTYERMADIIRGNTELRSQINAERQNLVKAPENFMPSFSRPLLGTVLGVAAGTYVVSALLWSIPFLGPYALIPAGVMALGGLAAYLWSRRNKKNKAASQQQQEQQQAQQPEKTDHDPNMPPPYGADVKPPAYTESTVASHTATPASDANASQSRWWQFWRRD